MRPIDREKIEYLNKINEHRKHRSIKNGSVFFKYAFFLMIISYFAYPDIARISPDDTTSSLFMTLIICSGSLWVVFLLIQPINTIMSKLQNHFRRNEK